MTDCKHERTRKVDVSLISGMPIDEHKKIIYENIEQCCRCRAYKIGDEWIQRIYKRGVNTK